MAHEKFLTIKLLPGIANHYRRVTVVINTDPTQYEE
jgi:hypothetical protein